MEIHVYSWAADRTSHFSLAWGRPPFHKGKNNTYWSCWIYSASARTMKELAMLGRSWIKPPELVVQKGDFISKEHDLTQRAFISERTRSGADPDKALLVNACIILMGNSMDDISLKVAGQSLRRGKDYSAVLINSLEGNKLLVWLNYKSTEELPIQILASHSDHQHR